MSSFTEIPLNPTRVAFAISKIGYVPSAAIMDIVDNSVTNNASEVIIDFKCSADTRFHSKGNVEEYSIIDNGSGMTKDEILNACRLGSPNDNYETKSLSKYGMGLKSAGFSLGDRIEIISIKDGILSPMAVIDKSIIQDRGKWGIELVELTEKVKVEIHDLIGSDHGTIVKILHCNYDEADSAKKTINNLKEKMGMTYGAFIQKGVEFHIRCNLGPQKDFQIEEYDIFFEKISLNEFYKDEYDCLTPIKVFDKEINLYPGAKPARLKAFIFPMDKMSLYHGFNPEQKNQVKNYKISSKNKGFFIYRNDRLIIWGDPLSRINNKNIVSRDLLGFRAKLEIDDSLDDYLHVDVSKQRLVVPEDVLNNLSIVLKNSLTYSKDAFELCKKKCDEKGDGQEGLAFNQRNAYLEEKDPEPQKKNNNPVVKKRKEEIIKKSIKVEEEQREDDIEDNIDLDTFKRVRYSDRIRGNKLFESYENPEEGVFVVINKNHYFYDTVLEKLNSQENIKQSLEAFIWALGVAENLTYENKTDVESDVLESVLKKYHELLSHNLNNWCEINQDLLS